MPDNYVQCPLPPNKKCQEVERLHARIAELEYQVVRMQYRDDNITQSRVFEIQWSKLLDPEEAMDIFFRNVKRIFGKEADHGI